MTHSNEKQQSYYNEKTMRHKIVNTILQQSYNIVHQRKTMKTENETHQSNTTLKNNIETQQSHTAITHKKIQQRKQQ
jgi:hypothetical protein